VADRAVLLVEGKNDEHVFYSLLEFHGIPEVFRIKDKQGIDNLLNTLDVELLASELERLGIVIDADTDLASRWQRITNILSVSGYSRIPPSPEHTGTIITEAGRPTVGIWLMPDNDLPGMLENFVSFLIPANDSLWNRVVNCIDNVPEGERKFPVQHLIKAQLHTWLAWQNDPGAPLGLAITKRYLEADAPHARTLIEWIRRLFVQP
jgi:hypothetical protein